MKTILQFSVCCLFIFLSCQPEPQPINYGQDECSFCRMTIVDERYAGELVTDKGKVYKFDAVECMINYMKENDQTSYAHKLISPYDSKTLKEAANCYYLRSEKLPSPMGMYITGISDMQTAKEFAREYDGRLFSWDELQKGFESLPVIQPKN